MLTELSNIKFIAAADHAIKCQEDIFNNSVWDLQLFCRNNLQIKHSKQRRIKYEVHGNFLED